MTGTAAWIKWLALLALVAMWGSAFLITETALAELTPTQLTAGRIWIGTLVLLIVTRPRGCTLLGTAVPWGYFFLVAVIGNCLPFTLIAWGQQFIASGEAGILMAIAPLEAILLAHFLVPGERLTARRLVGFLIGFAGVVLLFQPANLVGLITNPGQLGKLAVLAGATCYALTVILAQRQPGSDPYGTALGVLTAASLLMAIMLLASEAPVPRELSTATVAAVLALGALATGAATVVYFFLAREAGAGFLSLTNYLVPCAAATLGASIGAEELGVETWLALGVILAGVAIAEHSRSSRNEN